MTPNPGGPGQDLPRGGEAGVAPRGGEADAAPRGGQADVAPRGGEADVAPRCGEADVAPRCGLVAIVGRPNVGKSTLLNALVGQKISITSKKAQTTRHRITGVRTRGASQFVFVDTPGFQTRQQKPLNRTLNRTVRAVLDDVDLVLFVCEAGRFTLDDAKVLGMLQPEVEPPPAPRTAPRTATRTETRTELAPPPTGEAAIDAAAPPGAAPPRYRPVILVANKLDALARRQDVLPWLKQMQERHPFAEFVPLSAKKAADVERLLAIVEPHLPEQPWQYDEEALTDRSERFLASEIVREKLFRLTGDELPYTSTVVVDQFEEEGSEPSRRVRIAASIVVEREAHKGMVLGAGGDKLKRIGTEARMELEKLLEARVFLELWVKVRSGWADDEAHLRSYGYE